MKPEPLWHKLPTDVHISKEYCVEWRVENITIVLEHIQDVTYSCWSFLKRVLNYESVGMLHSSDLWMNCDIFHNFCCKYKRVFFENSLIFSRKYKEHNIEEQLHKYVFKHTGNILQEEFRASLWLVGPDGTMPLFRLPFPNKLTWLQIQIFNWQYF